MWPLWMLIAKKKEKKVHYFFSIEVHNSPKANMYFARVSGGLRRMAFCTPR